MDAALSATIIGYAGVLNLKLAVLCYKALNGLSLPYLADDCPSLALCFGDRSFTVTRGTYLGVEAASEDTSNPVYENLIICDILYLNFHT